MSELVSTIAVIVTVVLAFGMLQRRFERWERPWLWGALLAHLVAGVAQVIIVTKVYGGGDMMWYRRVGWMLAEFTMEYPAEGFAALGKAILHQQDIQVPVPILPGATGAMMGISGFLMLLLGGSIYGACVLFGSLTFLSKLAIYRVFRAELDPQLHRAALIGCLWVPSVVFWSSALLKESVAIAGLGAAIYGGHAMATGRRRWVGMLMLVLGLTATGSVKPYLLLPFGLAVGLWLYLDGPRPARARRLRQIRPLPFVLGVAMAVGFVLGVGELFPRFNPTGLVEEAADMQASLEWTHGGSDYAIGNPEDRTLSGQLKYAPIALLTALFRPTLFDVHNPMSAVNAVECTAITLLVLMALVRSGLMGFIRAIFSSPLLGFCAVYVLGIALGVGLATTNLGTLSRYRMPMMPFFVVMAGVLATRHRRWVGYHAPASASA